MSLAFMYKANAELSLKMAAAATTPEMRKKWTDLAAHWQKKSEMGDQFSEAGTKHLDDGPSISPSLTAPPVSPLVENQDLVPSLTQRDRGALLAVWSALQEPSGSPKSVPKIEPENMFEQLLNGRSKT